MAEIIPESLSCSDWCVLFVHHQVERRARPPFNQKLGTSSTLLAVFWKGTSSHQREPEIESPLAADPMEGAEGDARKGAWSPEVRRVKSAAKRGS